MFAMLVLLMAGLVSSSVICPDGTQCQDKNTCCLTERGYACCHYPNAVCCPDKAHCCPEDYQCDQQTQHCVKQRMTWYSFPMSPQIAAEGTEEKPSSPAVDLSSSSVPVVHCDDYYSCPGGTTCCRSPQGMWDCCAYSADEMGCCPRGSHCDGERRTCVNDFEKATPVVPLKQAIDNQVQAGVIRCDGRFFCPAAHTCCKTLSGQWGCCPYRLGQCCKDGKHCCEYGYNCDSTYSQCKKGYTSIPARPKKKALFL